MGWVSRAWAGHGCAPVKAARCFLGASSLAVALSLGLLGDATAQVAISDSGTPQYRVPIAVPPGIAGLVPTLALVHNSSGSDGPVGFGWSLEGVSVISRCPNIQAVDGTTLQGLSNSIEDKLCLDGQRLIQTDAAGAPMPFPQSADSQGLASGYREFRTEKDSFARIRAYGIAVGTNGSIAANGPAYFKVWTKAGRIQEYGVGANTTSNATIKAQGKDVVVTWALSRISDPRGNYIDFQYDQRSVAWGSAPTVGNPAPGKEWNLSEIRYTGTSTSTPANRISFVYDDRVATAPVGAANERAEIYHLGSKVVNVRRLSKVQTFINITATPIKVKTYKLTYDNGPKSNRNRLQQVAECAGATETPCLPPTKFEYTDGRTQQYISSPSFASSSMATTVMQTPDPKVLGPRVSRSVLIADFNGDGRADILKWADNPAENALFFSNGAGGFTTAPLFNITENLFKSNGCYASRVGDFNADGLPDILRYRAQNGSENSGFVVCAGTSDIYFNNGDGSFNRQVISGATLPINLSRSVNSSNAQPGEPGGDKNGWSPGQTFYVLDVNADGKLDFVTAFLPSQEPVLVPPTNPCAAIVCTRVFLSTGTGAFTEVSTNLANLVVYSSPEWALSLGQPSHVADIDANGLDDLVNVGAFGIDVEDTNWRSRGDGNFDSMASVSSVWGRGSTSLDFNGDGRADSLATTSSSSASSANLLVSNGVNALTYVANFNIGAAGVLVNNDLVYQRPISGVMPYDFDGDGRTDLLRWHNDPTQNALHLSNGDGTFRTAADFNLNAAGAYLRTGDDNIVAYVADFTGRGEAEILRVNSAAAAGGAGSNVLYIKSAAALPPDLLLAVVSPTGLRTTLTWVPVANSASGSLGARYTSERGQAPMPAAFAPVDAPPVDVLYHHLAPTFVVATMTADTGVGANQLVTEYSYAGLRSSYNGRGVRGFREVRRQGKAPDGSDLTVITQFNQVHPYVGTVQQTETRLGKLDQPAAQRLSLTTNLHCDKTAEAVDEAAASVVSPCVTRAKIQRPYVKTTTESAWDLGGVAMPVTTTNTTVNNTGDPATVAVSRQGAAMGLTMQNVTKTTGNLFATDNIACTNDTTCNWILGRVSSTTQTNSVPNDFANIVAVAGAAPNASATVGTGAIQTVTLSNVAFGNVNLGSSTNATATLAVNGGSAVNLSVPAAGSVTGTDFNFVSTTCSTSLAAGASCTVTIKFQPTVSGARSGSLTVSTAAGTFVADLSGTGVATSNVSVTANSASALSANKGGVSATGTVTFTNSGQAPANLSLAGLTSPYSVSPASCTAAAGGGTCVATVTMTTAGAIGAQGSQTLTATGATNGPVTASVSGTLLGSSVALTTNNATNLAATKGGAAATGTVVFTNSGNIATTLTMSGLTAPYSVSPASCSIAASGGTCTVTVSMASSGAFGAQGAQTLVATSTSSATTTAPVSGTVNGSSISVTANGASALTATQGGSAGTGTVTFTNSGNQAATLTLSGLTAPYSVSPASCSAAAGGGTCVVTVSMSAGGALGVQAAQTLTATGGTTGAATASVAGTLFGSVVTLSSNGASALSAPKGGAAATGSVTFVNNGNQAASLTMSGLTAPYSVTPTTCSAGAGGGTCVVSVSMSSAGSIGAQGTQTLTATGGTSGAASASVSGTVTGSIVSVSANTASALSAMRGAAAPSGTVTFANSGNVPVTLTLSGISAPYSLSASTCLVNAGSTCSVTVPMATSGAIGAQGTQTLTASGGTTGAATTTVSGTITAPPAAVMAVSPMSWNLGSAGQGVTVTKTFTVTNTGGTWPFSKSLANPNPVDALYAFGAGGTCPADGVLMPASSSCTVVVNFTGQLQCGGTLVQRTATLSVTAGSSTATSALTAANLVVSRTNPLCQ